MRGRPRLSRRLRWWLGGALALLAAAAGAAVWRHGRSHPPRNESLAVLESRVQTAPQDFVAWNHLAEARLREFGVSGELSYLDGAETAWRASRKIEPLGAKNLGGLAMEARVEFDRHRFRSARVCAEEVLGELPQLPLGHQLLGDVLYQQGDLAGAETAWRRMRETGEPAPACTWREAQLELARGHNPAALALLAQATHEAQAAPSATGAGIAWYEVQWGEWAFRTGDWETAEARYQEALRRAPQLYAALEHLAELRGAQGNVEEAVARYEELIARSKRPDMMQALGDLYLFQGQTGEAERWHRQALAAYLAATAIGGEAAFGHHLAGFFSDAQCVPEKAVAYARRDLEERSSSPAHDALAWALCKAGQNEEAKAESDLALASGVEDAHIIYHAGIIHMGCGDIAGGTALMRRAAAANPRFNAFHVHR